MLQTAVAHVPFLFLYIDGAMMAAAYSTNLRRKVVQACERGSAS